ncbi:MAG: hypothetical protein R2845_09210 [Thermomicrobiales bacterium]
MRITDVRVEQFDYTVPRPFRWRAGLPGSGTVNRNAWLIIETDEGLTGRAQSAHGSIIRELVDLRLRDMLVGHDPLLKEFLWERAWEIDRIEEPHLCAWPGRYRALGYHGASGRTPALQGDRRLSRPDPRVRIDDHLRND